LIRVLCAECGETFEIGEEFAGLTEFCPFCGALSDIPSLESLETPPPEEPLIAATDQPILPDPTELVFSPLPSRGIPSPIWWALIIAGVSFFIAGCVFLFSDNWEMHNIQGLNDAVNRGDVLMTDEDFTGAGDQYRWVLKTVGSREIESIYIRQLIERARHGAALAQTKEAQAQIDSHIAAANAPTSGPSPAAPADDHEALMKFQRDSEAFPQYIRNRSMDFQDDKGHWRRRQFTVWDVTYEHQTDSERPRIELSFSCASRITEPHDSRRDADNDGDFMDDDLPKTVHCKTLFELFAGQWIILHQDVDTGATPRPSSADFYELERQAFHAAIIPQ
jgi:hypothetical protein